MKENTKTPAQASFSLVGTQYLAWALSMLLVFTSITPAQAAGGKGKTFQLMLQARKGQPLSMELNAKLERQLRVATMGKTPLHLKINGQNFTLSTTDATALTGKQPARPTADLSALTAAPLQAQPLENANVDLAALFAQIGRAQQLLKQGDPDARKEAFDLLLPLVKQAQEMGRQVLADSDESLPYLADVKEFLDKAAEVLSKQETRPIDLDVLYQLAQGLSDCFFSGTTVTPNAVELNKATQTVNDLLRQRRDLSDDLAYAKDQRNTLKVAIVLLFIAYLYEEYRHYKENQEENQEENHE